MLAIIQERLKKINSQISTELLVSLCTTTTIFIFFIFYIVYFKENDNKTLIYNEKTEQLATSKQQKENTDTQIFASVNGKTYTFSWCSGSDKIKESNKIFFKSEEEAVATGRTLSKLCK